MKLTIFGCGYVGLVTGACLAKAGRQVCRTDANHNKATRPQQDQVSIFATGLGEVVATKSSLPEGTTDRLQRVIR